MVADEIAEEAEFFSFGTNDLTQTCLGLSRDDAGKFLPSYVVQGLLPEDPFVSIDRDGVGALMRIAVAKGRKTRKDLEIGICGEHGGDPEIGGFLSRHRPRLRQLFTVPGGDCQIGCGASGIAEKTYYFNS